MVWKKATPLGYQLHLIVQFHLLRKCGVLAHTSPAFLKNCWSKKLWLPAACPRNTTQIRFGKAGAHPQLALGIAIAPETLFLITTS